MSTFTVSRDMPTEPIYADTGLVEFLTNES